MTQRQLNDAMLAANNGSILMTIEDIRRITGKGRTWVAKLVEDLHPVTGKSYFYLDVAEKLNGFEFEH